MDKEEVSRMSNQERINLFGAEEASKYHGPYRRRNDNVGYLPALTEEGGQFYLSQLALKEEAQKKGKEYKILPTPREYVIPTQKAPRRKARKFEETP